MQSFAVAFIYLITLGWQKNSKNKSSASWNKDGFALQHREKKQKQGLANIIRMMLDEVQKEKRKKLQPHGKLWCENESGVDLSESQGCGGTHAEWAWSASGSPGPSVGWVRLREITIIQEPAGETGQRVAWGGLPLLPPRSDVARSQPPASQLHVYDFIPGEAFKCVHTRSVARL